MGNAIGVIGGSGLYEMEGFKRVEERVVETPFGAPSDALVGGSLSGREVWFLPRHGRGHRILPHEINHRANIWALRSLGVRWILCVTAVGSLKEAYAPRSLVIPDQYFDRTSRREHHTFFGNGIAAHIAFGEPTSRESRLLPSRLHPFSTATTRLSAGAVATRFDTPWRGQESQTIQTTRPCRPRLSPW